MNRIAIRTMAAALLMGTAFGSGAALAETKSVKITAIVEHPALDAVRKGTIDELAAQGYKDGETLRIEFQSAQGDVGTAGQIAQKFVGDNPDVIVPIATPSAQAVVSVARGRIPVVFSAVTDPVAARLVSDPKKPGGNVTGVTDLTPLGQQLDMIRSIVPKAKVIGVPFNPGEANAVVLVGLLKKEAADKGMSVIEAPAPTSNDVLSAARSLVGKADVIYTPTDNTVVSALESVIKVGQEGKIPVFSGDTDSVGRGTAASVGFDYYDVGRQTGTVVARVLKGEKPGDIPVSGVEKTQLFVNPASAKKMGVDIPEAVVKQAYKVVE